MDIIFIGSGIDLSLIKELIKNEKTVILIIPEKNKEISLGEEFAVFPFHKINLNFPVELLKIAKPKLREKRTKKKMFTTKPLSKPRNIYFERRRK